MIREIDDENPRQVEIEPGVWIEVEGQHNFWYFVKPKSELLEGAFTSIQKAKDQYVVFKSQAKKKKTEKVEKAPEASS